MIALSLLFFIVGIFINYLIATKFEEIAQEKGYYDYLWWCFFLGIAGYLMVVALPTKTGAAQQTNNVTQHNAQSSSSGYFLHDLASNGTDKSRSNSWRCPGCGEINTNNSIQCKSCGKYK